jgi:4-hydroxy-tetrahydrodipicolinate synthase
MYPSGALDPERASTFVISITPFAADGSFDEPGVRRHMRRMAAAGIGLYLGGGGSGEGFVLRRDEARRLLEVGVEELKGKVPVRSMGTEPRTADEMVEYVRLAKAAGVDATQIY